MSDKKKPRKSTAGVLTQKATDMKFIDFAKLGKDAAELGATHAKKNMRVIKKRINKKRRKK